MTDPAFLARAIAQGRGREKADLVLKGGRVFDLVSGELTRSDVAICGDRIVGTHGDYSGVARDRRQPAKSSFPASSTPIATSNPRC